MNTIQRTALLVHRDTIVKNVDLKYIKEKLLALGIIDVEELEEIDYEKTRPAKIRKLLDLLPKKSSQTFLKFISILEADYDWLAEVLGKFSNPDSPDAAIRVSPIEVSSNESASTQLQEALIAGGVPFPPPHLIPRTSKIATIRQCLREMERGQFAVLHGMAGAGKSVLAAESVRSVELMLNIFDKNVYWLTLGQIEKDTLLTRMQALCERLDNCQLPPLSIDQATERLRKLMQESKRRNSLLILDDVWRGEVIRAFDFGCKVLVTTRDASVTDVVSGRAIPIKVQDGFTQEETMTYLSSCLQIPEQELPDQAYQIYSESKGSPMVLSLLAPVLAEQIQQRPTDLRRWDHYVDKLRNRNYSQMKHHGPYNYMTVNEAIAISVENLDKETRSIFTDFVIFLDDVNIPTQVLEVLWNTTQYDMEEKVGVLIKKSLIAQYVLQQSYSVVYGIHDLLLDYLKSHTTVEEQQKIHQKLVDSYLKRCEMKFGSLPNDNYIFWFLGYHLYKADYTHLFKDIYLDLNFISAKLRATGPSDLLNDFRKYENYISGPDGTYTQHVEDFTRFIRTCGHQVVQCPTLDIVQLALQQPKSSTVFQLAFSCAKNAKDGFYLEWCNQEESRGHVLRSTVLNYGHVTAACFTEDGQRLLSAIGDGQIRMWDVDSGKELHHFTGHNGCVNHLALSADHKRLVSSSSDGTAKVWDLLSVTRKLDDALQRPAKTPSPRMRQDSWHNMFDVSGRVITDNSETTYTGHLNEVLCSQFSENGALIVSCGMDKTARVWLSIAGMELGVLKHSETVNTCCFSPSGNYIATGCVDSSIWIWNASSYTTIAVFREQNSRVLYVSFLADSSLLSVSDTQIVVWNWIYPGEEDEFNPSYSVNCIDSSNNYCYQCAAVSDDGNLLAVATSNDSVVLYSLEKSQQIYEFVGHSELITSLHFSPIKDDSVSPHWLLSGSLDDTVMVWKVDMEHIEDKSLSATAYHSVWSRDQNDSMLVASATTDNTIMVMSGLSGRVLHSVNVEGKVELCVVSHGAAMLAWITEAGHIQLMSFNAKLVKTVGHHSDRRPTLLKFSPTDVLLLSSSIDGCIKIWKPNGDSVTIWGPRKGVVDCFLMDSETFLGVCGIDGSLKIWRVDNGQPFSTILDDIGLHVTCVDRSNDGFWFAQGTTGHGIQVVSINSQVKKLGKQPVSLGCRDTPVRVCRFATSWTYLAAGYDNGFIEVFDYTRHVLIATLEGHRSWIRDLKFVSNSPYYQLVSLGDRIVWWNLSRTSLSANLTGGFGFPLTPVSPDSKYFNGQPENSLSLVQTFEFHGRFAYKLFVSRDSLVINTITDSGIFYILRQLTD